MAKLRENSTVQKDGEDKLIVLGDKAYEIQKNGTDGTGIINFKT